MFDIYQDKKELYSVQDDLELNKLKRVNLLDIKKLITDYNKYVFKDILEPRKKNLNCLKNCYSQLDNQNFEMQDLLQLKNCKQNCREEIQDLKKFYQNIEYLKKLRDCDDKCKKLDDDYECLWICHNKIDRRYREYWLNQRDGIIARHKVLNQ